MYFVSFELCWVLKKMYMKKCWKLSFYSSFYLFCKNSWVQLIFFEIGLSCQYVKYFFSLFTLSLLTFLFFMSIHELCWNGKEFSLVLSNFYSFFSKFITVSFFKEKSMSCVEIEKSCTSYFFFIEIKKLIIDGTLVDHFDD